MSKTLLFAILASAVALLASLDTTNAEEAKPAMTTETKTPKPEKSGLLPINGLNYYYAIYGKGEPLLLLHGGLGTTDMFAPILPKLAENRTVIGIDMQGHGRTALGDRPFTLEAMGDDMAAIAKALGYDQVDVMGYSLGGGIALRMAVQHPEAEFVRCRAERAFDPPPFDIREPVDLIEPAPPDDADDGPGHPSVIQLA